MTAVVRRPGVWLVMLLAALLAYCAVPAPAGLLDDEPPDALVQEVMSHRIVHMDTCDLEALRLTGAECVVTQDDQRRYWMILFDDNIKINMVVLYDGATSVLWCKATACT